MMKNGMLVLLMGILLFPTGLFSQSNEGTDFWMAFMEHRDINANQKVLMITARVATAGTVSIPLQNWSQGFVVDANNVVFVTLPNSAETQGSESQRNTGVRIQSDAPVSIYAHQYANFRSEASVVLPIESVGSEYFVMSYNGYQGNTTIYPSEFLMVAMEDETTISYEVTDQTLGGSSAGSSRTIVLDQGQTWQVQSSEAESGDLTGSHIVADKKISVFSGAKWTQVPIGCGTRDNLYEQMYPVSTWGRRFVSVLSKDASSDQIRVLASENNTQVFVDNVLSATLGSGEFYEFRNTKSAVFIEGSKSILVAQFNIGNNCNTLSSVGDPSMVLLNSVEQTRDTVTLYSSSFENIDNNYLNIVTRTENATLSDIFLDGTLISNASNQFIPLTGNPDFSYAALQVSTGSHTIFATGCGVIATVYGYGAAESYSYAGGASFREINLNPIPDGGCLNDTIVFSTGLPEERVQVFWDFGDGTTSTEVEPSHIYAGLGTYPVELVLWDLCQGTVDTFNQDLLVSLRQAVESGNDTLVCSGEMVFLSATDLAGATYEWTGPNDYFVEEQFPILVDPDTTFTGAYSVIGIISGCATFPKITEVEIQALPTPNLGSDSTICDADPITLDPGTHFLYRWHDGSEEQTFTLTEEGLFWVEVEDMLGCIGNDSILIRESCPTTLYVPSGFSPNNDDHNDLFLAKGKDILEYHLRVFNRWGQIVFETQQIEEGWDGTTPNGGTAPEGVYIWMVDYMGQRTRGTDYRDQDAGTVTLIR